jgi:leucyl-tRNA synthetase
MSQEPVDPDVANDPTRYDPLAIEEPIARRWFTDGTYSTSPSAADPPTYLLTMFPYPSGDLHMGHAEIFSLHDALVRQRRMLGERVLNPIGWDAFGLPAENAARKRGIDPRTWTYANIEEQAASIARLGYSFDWSTRLNTCDPTYYRWTQWVFVQLMKAGLADRREGLVNWCPGCETVLANEQVIDGRCERSDDLVIRRPLVQWYLRISTYAQQLLDDLAGLDWPDRVKNIQRNWIGRSEGAILRFAVAGTDDQVEVYTTRPDTLFGATYAVFAPEHPLVLAHMAGGPDFEAFRADVTMRSEIERLSTFEGQPDKRGLRCNFDVVNPINGEHLPAFAADYVLMDYGTGAIMAVPFGDQRDLDFARQQGLPVRAIIRPADAADPLDPDTMTEAWVGPGTLVNSGRFDGLDTVEGGRAITAELAARGLAEATVKFRLRDWLVSRQRSWGAPVPVIHCPQCGPVPVPEEDLPVELPDDLDFSVNGSPLAEHPTWRFVSCPDCGGDAQRDTDTMDTFVDSSWYFLRFLSPNDTDQAWPRDLADAVLPIAQYTGGVEHAVLHLLYARFVVKALRDQSLLSADEPFQALLNQGQVILNGASMSKSKGNLVTPIEVYGIYGADTLRATMLFASPPEDDIDWGQVSPSGMHRWLSRLWRLALADVTVDEGADAGTPGTGSAADALGLRRATHLAIDGCTSDYAAHKYNTVIAKLMGLTNSVREATRAGVTGAPVDEAVDAALLMLAPICPFITEELWTRRGHEGSVHDQRWPMADATLLTQDSVELVVQVDGKVRARMTVDQGTPDAELADRARQLDPIGPLLTGREVARTIVVADRLVNFVLRKP